MKHYPTSPPNPAEARALTARLADWRAFAAAAGATLAATSAADASIIYVQPSSPETVTLPATPGAPAHAALEFPVDGVSCTLFARQFHVGGSQGAVALVHGPAYSYRSGPGLSFFRGKSTADNFAPGRPVAGATQQTFVEMRLDYVVGSNALRRDAFPLNQTAFAGFQLPASKGGGMGWMRFEVLDRNNDGFADGVEVIDWAYNDAGGGISAGQTTNAVPEPGTTALALLAAGSAGVLAWRKRRNAESQHTPAA
jgi:hypothetical protein